MDKKYIETIFNNIDSKKINIYKNIKTLNTMKQYINVAKRNGINFEVGMGKGNQKAIVLKRSDGSTLGEIKDALYPLNKRISIDLSKDKLKTEKILSEFKINTTFSKIYELDEVKKAQLEFYDNRTKFTVIKPLNFSGGKGVNVKVSEEHFSFYWQDTANIIQSSNRTEKKLLVQNYIEGFEVRAVILLGKLISVVVRLPAYVRGNGIDSVEGLIKKKNRLRTKCSNLKHRLITIDEKMEKYLVKDGIKLTDVIPENEIILLSSLSNISHGGETVDITPYINSETRAIALNAIAAIPGMYSGGVDIMIKNFEDTSPYVIEVNAWPMLQSTIYPTYGKRHYPQEYFLNSIYAIDKFLNNKSENSDNAYVRTYFNFILRKQKLHEKSIIEKYV